MFTACPSCCAQISRPIPSGLQLCKRCGWKGRAVAPRRTRAAPGRDIGLEAAASVIGFVRKISRSARPRPITTGRWVAPDWLGLVLIFTAMSILPVVSYRNRQQQSGHPIDPNYVWAALDPRNWVGNDNGPGGADWRIGEPLTGWMEGMTPRSLAEGRAYALRLVNRDRARNTRGLLVPDALLDAAAQRHAEDMLRRNYFAHVAPEGTNSLDRYLAVGGSAREGIGENIHMTNGQVRGALDYRTIEQAEKNWMDSDAHRRNLLDPSHRRFGYGIALDPLRGRMYAVQEFASP